MGFQDSDSNLHFEVIDFCYFSLSMSSICSACVSKLYKKIAIWHYVLLLILASDHQRYSLQEIIIKVC